MSDVKILRIKEVPSGFSVFASCEGKERGFTFPHDAGLDEIVDGVPKFVEKIHAEFEKEKLKSVDGAQKVSALKNLEGSVFKITAKKLENSKA